MQVGELAVGRGSWQSCCGFASKMSDADAECAETQVWIEFSKDCGYLSDEKHKNRMKVYEEAGRMLGSMIANPAEFKPRVGDGSKQTRP